MNTNLHLSFADGQCDAAFRFYETVFGTDRIITSRWRDAPAEMHVAEDAKDLVMHTSLKVGSIILMGADHPPGRGNPPAGFDISLDSPDEAEVRRLFAALSDGGAVTMLLGPTFWSSLFGICTDRFGIGWMVSIPGPQA